VKKKSPLSAFLSLLLLSTLLLTFLAAPAHAELSWNVQTVDENAAGIGNGYCPIAVDSNNNPHISSRVFLSGQRLSVGYTSTIMYATANITEPAGSPAFPLLIVSAAITIGTIIAVIAYVWKKKTKH
jgi:hypothetical protein